MTTKENTEVLHSLQSEFDAEKLKVRIKAQKPDLLLTTICPFCKEDQPYLIEHIESLPAGTQVIYMLTIPVDSQDETGIKITGVNDDGLTIEAEYRYTGTFLFDETFNAALSIAAGEFVLKLDADERLLPFQHKDMLRELNRVRDKGGYNGMTMKVINFHNGGAFSHFDTVRLFRNTESIKYKSPSHETIEYMLAETQNTIIYSNFVIWHLGYMMDKTKYKKKLIRNLKAAAIKPEFYQENPVSLTALFRDLNNLMLILEGEKK